METKPPLHANDLKARLFGRTDNGLVQFVRYFFVGGFAFVVDFSSLIFLTEALKIHYLVSAALAFTLGLFVNYIISVIWVFSKRKYESRFLEFAVYAVIGLIGVGILELMMWALTSKLSIHYAISKIISTGVVYLWNFFARKFILF